MNTHHTGSRYPICEKCHKRQYERGQTFTPGDNCECSTNHTDSVEAVFKQYEEMRGQSHTNIWNNCVLPALQARNTQHTDSAEAAEEVNYETREYDGIRWIRYDHHEHATTTLQATHQQQVEEAVRIDENTSDGYHTFKELYEFRLLYNAHLFNEWAKQGMYDVHKSTKHSDGADCFGGGWFIVVASLPSGDISNHYEMKDWDLFQCHIRRTAKEWDGHTSQDVAQRLREALTTNHQD